MRKLISRIGKMPACVTGAGVFEGAAAEVLGDRRMAFTVPVETYERLGIPGGQGAQQNGVHEAVDGGVRADADSKRERRHDGEQRMTGHGAHGEAQILPQIVPKRGGRTWFEPTPSAVETAPRRSSWALISDDKM